MMRSLLVGIALLACATSAEAAEAWTCSHAELILDPRDLSRPTHQPQLFRFTVSPPEVIGDIGAMTGLHFRIVQNDDRALVATWVLSENTEDQKGDPTVGAGTVAINKATGEFGLAFVGALAQQEPYPELPMHGNVSKTSAVAFDPKLPYRRIAGPEELRRVDRAILSAVSVKPIDLQWYKKGSWQHREPGAASSGTAGGNVRIGARASRSLTPSTTLCKQVVAAQPCTCGGLALCLRQAKERNNGQGSLCSL